MVFVTHTINNKFDHENKMFIWIKGAHKIFRVYTNLKTVGDVWTIWLSQISH